MKKYAIYALSGLMMASCVDTNVLPEDIIVGDDFWQTRDDVSMMVAGAYYQMCTSDVMQRLIVWGSARSDEFVPSSQTISNNDVYTYLEEMNAGTMDDENTFANWAGLYTVINRCNQVLDRASGVMLLDPSYTEATYLTDRSQMLALRALAYFYLVRAFRDVPYSGEAYYNTSQEMDLPQEAPGVVLQHCIDDLTEALQAPLSPTSYNDWRRVGLINRDAIKAILADVYLWRASMTGSASDYQQCADLCKEVIDSKTAIAESQTMMPGFSGSVDLAANNGYPLYNGASAYQQIFTNGNSDEAIFELQFGGSGSGQNSNNGLAALYWAYRNTSATTGHGYLEPSANVFESNSGATDVEAPLGNGMAFYTQNDYRFGESTLNVALYGTSNTGYLGVRKMIDLSTYSQTTTAADRMVTSMTAPRTDYGAFNQNWIVYRITDVMLMRAEALVQLATSDTDPQLASAFDLVRGVNSRGLDNTTEGTDSLQFADFATNTKQTLEQLVLAERLRELCYEGKRWFDLMRYNYRHCTGTVDITRTMNQILDGANISAYPVTSSEQFVDFVVRKYSQVGSMRTNLNSEPKLYFPVYISEMNANVQLEQNPAYANIGSYERN